MEVQHADGGKYYLINKLILIIIKFSVSPTKFGVILKFPDLCGSINILVLLGVTSATKVLC